MQLLDCSLRAVGLGWLMAGSIAVRLRLDFAVHSKNRTISQKISYNIPAEGHDLLLSDTTEQQPLGPQTGSTMATITATNNRILRRTDRKAPTWENTLCKIDIFYKTHRRSTALLVPHSRHEDLLNETIH